MARTLAVLLGLVLACSGCPARTPAGSESPAASATATSPDPGSTGPDGTPARPAASSPAETPGGPATPSSPPPEDTVQYGPPGPGPNNTMPLKVTLTPTCAEPGDTMSSTATTLPGAQLAFTASYSDNNRIPDFEYVPGEANPTGTFTWRWEILPTHPRGEGQLSVVAALDDRGASYKVDFRIADRC
ncbi:MAG TPA: hypothetical protein VGB83_04710 [Actinomycetota bacterium]